MIKHMKTAVFVTFVGMLGFLASVAASEDAWLIRATEDTGEEPPKTIESAETRGGAAAPVQLMRQSERKKPPEPDYLVGKVIWGEAATFTDPSGGEMEVDDWNLVPGDVSNLIDVGRSVGQDYHWSNIHLDEFSFDPDKMPVLFISGVRTLRISDGHKANLRQYVQDGGMVILDSVYGSPHFTESARETFREIFPGRQFRDLPSDHPIFETYYEVESVNYPEQVDRDEPYLEGMYIGARVGVLLSPYGMGTGLAEEQDVFDELRERGLEPKYMDSQSAQRLATNFVGYSVGYAEVGEVQGEAEQYGEADRDAATDEFVFAQIRHEGAWDAHPGAANALLRRLRQTSAINVHLRRQAVDLAEDDLSPYTFLYLTGLDTFEFSSEEREALRDFVENDGFLVVNNGLGLSRFHQAATRELRNIFPDSRLESLSPDHEIFHIMAPAYQVNYTSVIRRNEPELGNTPMLMGMEHEGELAVVYSPYDLEGGWLNVEDIPLMRGYENQSAQHLGMNLIAYSMLR